MILLAALALSQVDPIALGRARADFGEILNGGKWKLVPTGFFHQTQILFPSGRADIRYYLVPLNGPGLRLCRLSKRAGKIHRDWMFEATKPSKASAQTVNSGTLGAMLEGFELPKGLSKSTLDDLASRRSYAWYAPQGGASPIYTFCRFGENPFIRTDDVPVKLRGGWNIPDSEMRLVPRTKSPYPITPEELDEIKKGIAPAKN